MNNMTRKMVWGAAILGAALVPGAVAANAAEGREAFGERMERMERRLDQIAAQQEQWLRQARAQAERMEQRFGQQPGRREEFNRPEGAQGARPGPKMQGPAENLRPPMPPGPPARPFLPREGAPLLARPLKGIQDALGLIVLVWIVCNILMMIWIFGDIRKRGEGSAIFGVMALFAGIPAAVIYALVRIGDRVAAGPGPGGRAGSGESAGSGSAASVAGKPS